MVTETVSNLNTTPKQKGKNFGTILRMENTKTGTVYWLVGTNHLSQNSQQQVKQVIRAVKPDCVAIELCPDRCPERFGVRSGRNVFCSSPVMIDPKKVLPVPPGLFPLNVFYRNLGLLLEVIPGGEFIVALNEACAQKLPVVLLDMKFSRTRKRLQLLLNQNPFTLNLLIPSLSHFGPLGGLKGFLRLVANAPNSTSLSPSQREALQNLLERDSDILSKNPIFSKLLLVDRDKYMASQLRQIHHKTVVAVFGEGHMEGIARHLNDHQVDEKRFRKSLKEVPGEFLEAPRLSIMKLVRNFWLFKVMVVGSVGVLGGGLGVVHSLFKRKIPYVGRVVMPVTVLCALSLSFSVFSRDYIEPCKSIFEQGQPTIKQRGVATKT